MQKSSTNVRKRKSSSDKKKWSSSKMTPTSSDPKQAQLLRKMSVAITNGDHGQQQSLPQTEAATGIGSGGFVERYRRVYPDREPTFTDKDRAAAVTMGTKDIKVSLQVKKKRERRRDEPGEREFRIRFALADRELRSANPSRALHFVTKALELRPKNRECFVVRSKCHLMLGHAKIALMDAEKALNIDALYAKAVCAKADALYSLGDFEHALVCYHRGHHLRPESEEFRLGIQKAEEAIQNVIDYNNTVNKQRSSASDYPPTVSPTPIEKVQQSSDLQPDIEFLTKLLDNAEIRSLKQPENCLIEKHANEVLDFLRSRQDLWSQQRPRSIHQTNK